MRNSILSNILCLAKLITSGEKWVKFNSKSQKQGWKRKRDNGGYEYRYQDNDPNKEKVENGEKSKESPMSLSLKDVINSPFYNVKHNFGGIWEEPQKISKGKYRIDSSLYGNPQTWEAETQEYEGGPLGFKNKLLTQELYKKAGIYIGSTYLSDVKNKPAIYTKIEDSISLNTPELKAQKILINPEEFLKGFVVDALLGNKDVFGKDFENVSVSDSGIVQRIGNRKALLFREGGLDSLSDEVTEINDFRDARKYPQLAKIYSNIREKDVLSQIAKTLQRLNDETLKNLIYEILKKPEEKQFANAIFNKLLKRKRSLLEYAKVKAIEAIQENVLKRKEKYVVGYENVKTPQVLSNEEKNAIYGYTVADYQEINKYLRGEKLPYLIEEEQEGLKVKSNMLVKALRKLPAYKGTVYRGTELDDASILTIMTMKPGDLIYMKAFTSTSLLKEKASGFSTDVLFEIKSLTGRQVSHISEYPEENEVVLSPDTRYEISEISYKDQTIHVQLRELRQTESKTKMPVNIRNKRKMNPEEMRKFLLSNPKLTQKQRERIMRLNPDQLLKVIVAILSNKKGKSEEQEEPVSGKFTEIFI